MKYQIEGCEQYDSVESCLENWALDACALYNSGRVDVSALEPLTVNVLAVGELVAVRTYPVDEIVAILGDLEPRAFGAG